MNIHSRGTQITAAALFVVALFLFNQTGRSERSQEQLNYDQWLTHTEPKLLELADSLSVKSNGKESSSASSEATSASTDANTTSHEKLPSVSITIAYGAAALGKSFVLNPQREAAEIRKLLRVLQLIREADVLSLKPAEIPRADSDATVNLAVLDGTSEFRTTFMSSDINDNPAALLLLRLMEEYAQQNMHRPNAEEVIFDGKA